MSEILRENDLWEYLKAYLQVPDRFNSKNNEILQKLWKFLQWKWFIKWIWVSNDWWFSYNSWTRNIYSASASNAMPKEAYNYYIFRLWKETSNQANLFPDYWKETDRYRFLHEVWHAYQDYLINKEFPSNPDNWYTEAVSWRINSNFAKLYKLCFELRTTPENRGLWLSTWGNVPNYDNPSYDPTWVRALEDANELVTMYLWHYEYFATFMDYLSLDIRWYDKSSIIKDWLIPLDQETKQEIETLVIELIKQIIRDIDSLQYRNRVIWLMKNIKSKILKILLI